MNNDTFSLSCTPAGIILTHDLTNRKSQVNLHRWLAEVLLRDAGGGVGSGGGGGRRSTSALVEDFDAENFGGFAQVYGLKKVVMVFFLFFFICGGNLCIHHASFHFFSFVSFCCLYLVLFSCIALIRFCFFLLG